MYYLCSKLNHLTFLCVSLIMQKNQDVLLLFLSLCCSVFISVQGKLSFTSTFIPFLLCSVQSSILSSCTNVLFSYLMSWFGSFNNINISYYTSFSFFSFSLFCSIPFLPNVLYSLQICSILFPSVLWHIIVLYSVLHWSYHPAWSVSFPSISVLSNCTNSLPIFLFHFSRGQSSLVHFSPATLVFYPALFRSIFHQLSWTHFFVRLHTQAVPTDMNAFIPLSVWFRSQLYISGWCLCRSSAVPGTHVKRRRRRETVSVQRVVHAKHLYGVRRFCWAMILFCCSHWLSSWSYVVEMCPVRG